MSPAERDVLERSFARFDTDGNGRIDRREFASLVRRMGFHKPDAVIEHAFADIDNAQRGFIDIGQFRTWWQRYSPAQTELPSHPD